MGQAQVCRASQNIIKVIVKGLNSIMYNYNAFNSGQLPSHLPAMIKWDLQRDSNSPH